MMSGSSFFTRRIVVTVLCALAVIAAVLFAYSWSFGPAGSDTKTKQFIIEPNESFDDAVAQLASEGLIRHAWAFRLAYKKESGDRKDIRPGGYEIAPSMDTWTVAEILAQSPYLAWVKIPPGYRKEQIADVLAKALSWTPAEKQEWIDVDTASVPSYVEGVYYPDTYLIASDQEPAQVAERLRDRFNQVFAPYATEAAQKNIKWTDAITIASLIEREAAGPDMKLISGILWNRLKVGMALQVDATLQYAKGNADIGWWPRVASADKYIDSPYNTYKYPGLPPHPIAEPSEAAIDAAINPQATDCIYYLHDRNSQIHCSKTYAGQLANVNKYLK
jgi:UPF0755 protein